MLYTSKESLEHIEFRFRMKKLWFFLKNPQILKFFRFWSKGGTLWSRSKKFSFFWNFKIFGNFFEKWPQGVLGNVKRNKVMKYEFIWSVRQGVTQDHLHVRVDCTPPPCSIGLIKTNSWNFIKIIKVRYPEEPNSFALYRKCKFQYKSKNIF